MKKIVFLIICPMILLSACGNAETVSQPSGTESVVQFSAESSEEKKDIQSSSEESDELWEKMNETDERIKNFLENDEYKNAEKDTKAEMALKFVEELQKDGLIQHYDYFENNEMISYTHLNGVSGGISFRDFSEEIDGPAMN